jgi:hypothetical protein
MNYRTLSVNKMNDNNESTKETVPTSTPLLKIIEDMLHDIIAKKKVDTRKRHEIAETEKIWTEIETLQWVLLES